VLPLSLVLLLMLLQMPLGLMLLPLLHLLPLGLVLLMALCGDDGMCLVKRLAEGKGLCWGCLYLRWG
jgi:hypothetical protein